MSTKYNTAIGVDNKIKGDGNLVAGGDNCVHGNGNIILSSRNGQCSAPGGNLVRRDDIEE